MPDQALAIIHTTPVTVPVLKELAAELMPQCKTMNFMDDTILPQLASNGGDLSVVEERWFHYARIAEKLGAHAVLSACSSVGEVAEKARGTVSIPVWRIDEAMAEAAVGQGSRIGVAATLSTTLEPTIRLLKNKAEKQGKSVKLQSALAEHAYRLLIDGDQAGHDKVLAEVLLRLAESSDAVVLAQASMARVVDQLPQSVRNRFLSSPRSGMEQAATWLGRNSRHGALNHAEEESR